MSAMALSTVEIGVHRMKRYGIYVAGGILIRAWPSPPSLTKIHQNSSAEYGVQHTLKVDHGNVRRCAGCLSLSKRYINKQQTVFPERY